MKKISVEEAIRRMLDGEEVYLKNIHNGNCYSYKFEGHNFKSHPYPLILSSVLDTTDVYFWYINEPPKTRPMTEREILAWQCNDSHGWCIISSDGILYPPQYFCISLKHPRYKRARISLDGTIGEPEEFVVEVEG